MCVCVCACAPVEGKRDVKAWARKDAKRRTEEKRELKS